MPVSEAYNIDCLEYMRTLPDGAFDLAVVDPPYGDGSASGDEETGLRFHGGDRWDKYLMEPSKTESTSNRFGGRFEKYGAVTSLDWDVAPKKEYFDELFRVSKNQIIFGGNYFDLPPTRCFIVWRKTNIPLDGFSMAPAEYAWTSFKENASMYECRSSRDETSGRFHPTEKPIALYDWIFSRYANPGDKILDTHLGSGSSRIAAYNAGLDFVGCEINAGYFEQEEARFEAYTAQMSLFVGE